MIVSKTIDQRKDSFYQLFKVRNLFYLLRINGERNHLHILTSLHPSLALSDFIREIKVASSKWIPEQKIFPAFDGWQKGYSAFTHAVNDKKRLIQYIINQKEHHRKLTFKEELVNLLKQAQIEFDMKYLA